MEPEERTPQLPADILRLIAKQNPQAYNRLTRLSLAHREALYKQEVLREICFDPPSQLELQNYINNLKVINGIKLFNRNNLWQYIRINIYPRDFDYTLWYGTIDKKNGTLPIEDLSIFLKDYWNLGYNVVDVVTRYHIFRRRASCSKFISKKEIIDYLVDYVARTINRLKQRVTDQFKRYITENKPTRPLVRSFGNFIGSFSHGFIYGYESLSEVIDDDVILGRIRTIEDFNKIIIDVLVDLREYLMSLE